MHNVDCAELKLECITSTLHPGGRGEGRCVNLTSYYVSVPRVLTRVVAASFVDKIAKVIFSLFLKPGGSQRMML